jgi:drug/metabolite transporter (DMT)-like permease
MRATELNKDINLNNTTILLSSDNKQILEEVKDPIPSERMSIFLVALGNMFFGISGFHIKFTKLTFPEEFDPNTFLLFRSLANMTISLIVLKYNRIPILDVRTVKDRFWFLLRTVGNYVSFLCFIVSIMYLRAATAASLVSIHPVLVVIFSIFILKEKFHIRYIIGFLLCFSGTMMIISNEKKVSTGIGDPNFNQFDADVDGALNDIDNNHNSTTNTSIGISTIHGPEPIENEMTNIIKGTFFGLMCMTLTSCCIVASKILIKGGLLNENINFYIGLSNLICGTIFVTFSGFNPFGIKYFLLCSFNGLLFYFATRFLTEGFKGIDLSKATPLAYLNTFTVFVLGVLILHEQLYLTDIIGSFIILFYNIYNTIYPVK